MKAVIFDLDGTLVTTETDYRRKLIKDILLKFGYSASDNDADLIWFSHDRISLLNKWNIPFMNVWNEFDKYTTEIAEHTVPYDDVGILSDVGKSALLTGSRRPLALQKLKRIDHEFDAIVITDPNGDAPSKPDPMGVRLCLEKMGTNLANTIYVGNSDEDILTAKNAGMFSILIDRKEHPHESHPNAKIESLYELARFL